MVYGGVVLITGLGDTRGYPNDLPPKIEVTIVHDNGDDQCRAIVSDTVALDLGDLKTYVTGELNLVIVPLGTEDNFFLYHAP